MRGVRPMNVSGVSMSALASRSRRTVAVSLPKVAALSGVTWRVSMTSTFAPLARRSFIDSRRRDDRRRRGHDESGAFAARGGVDLRVVVQKKADPGGIGNRPHERGGTEIVLRVDVGATVDKQAHGVERADFGGVHEGSDAAVVGDVGARVGVEEGFELGEVVFADRGVEVIGGGLAFILS